MKIDPRLKKYLGFGLMGSGALAVMSGVVNILAAWQLVDVSDAESLGVSRNELVLTYAGILVVGVALIAFGWRVKK